MGRVFMKITSKTPGKIILMTIFAALTACMLSGCSEIAEDGSGIPLWGPFRFQVELTDEQVRWLLLTETILIILLILLIILLITMFHRYQSVSKRVIESKMRERALTEENEMLNRLDQAKTEFLQNMSHDLKTPLTVISTSVLNVIDMLDFEYSKEEMMESLILAQSEIIRVSRVMDNALKHTALQSDRPSTEPINMPRFLRKIEKTYNAYLYKNGNTLKIQVSKTLPNARFNVDTLFNIFSNLISNANRYTRRGVITISVELIEKKPSQAHRFIEITVNDTGMGVDPEILPIIFNRGVSKTKSGLGLPICKSAIETFGGTIRIDSVYGKGTKVVFTIPVYEESTSDTEGSSEAV